ncbi:hypothetical protein [Undibacterium sp.]|uniref:hypothetical protein n=1 Tax=Undibacterium sp. TaxID=1914977 RepID=UPI003750BD47
MLADCSRPIQVPVAVSGFSVIANGNKFSGIMPEFLGQVEAKTNCRFVFYYVPKSRQEFLFETGKADLLIATIKTDRREKYGHFIPLIQLRATLISVEDKHPAIQNAKDLISRHKLRLVVVRGYDYGPIYQSIVEEMKALGRLAVETDPISAGRMMQNNSNYVTIMAPTLFSGVVQTEEILKNLRGKLRFDKLDDLPWNESGIYISKTSLNPSDQQYLKTQFEKYASTDAIWKSYLSYYSPEVIRLGLRPRELANQ